MAKVATIDRFRRGETVKTLDALPGVPVGAKGRVNLVDGFAWIRYRVLFDNGVDVGSLDGSTLARPRQYQEALDRRARAVEEADSAAVGEDEEAESAAAAGGDSKVVNGVTVPPHLIERSQRARERLAA